MMNWHHSGFNVYCGKAIWPHNQEGLESLARHIIRASFSQERMTCVAANDSCAGVAKIIYQSKDEVRMEHPRKHSTPWIGSPNW